MQGDAVPLRFLGVCRFQVRDFFVQGVHGSMQCVDFFLLYFDLRRYDAFCRQRFFLALNYLLRLPLIILQPLHQSGFFPLLLLELPRIQMLFRRARLLLDTAL